MVYFFFLFSNGKKYILRTDIMYENVSPSRISDEQERALQMMQEADRLEVILDRYE